MNRRLRFGILIGLLSVLACPSSRSQDNPNIENGYHPYGSYDVSKVDGVGLASGSLNVRIPIVTYPQRGKFGAATVALELGSKSWHANAICNTVLDTCNVNWSPSGGGTLNKVGMVLVADYGVPQAVFQPQSKSSLVGTWGARDADGGIHWMIGLNSTNYVAADGSGIVCQNCTYSSNSSTSTIYDKSGVKNFYPPGTPSILVNEDANGNEEIVNGTSSLLDSMGRQIIQSEVSTDTSGCSGAFPTASATLTTMPGVNGGSTLLKKCFASITIKTNYQQTYTDVYGNPDPIKEYVGAWTVLQSVILYNGTSWTASPAWIFEYNAGQNGTGIVNYGDLTKITFPTGGTTSYTWGTLGTGCAAQSVTPVSRWVLTRTEDAHDGSPKMTSTYNYSSANTVVTDAAGNDTNHVFSTFGSCSAYEVSTVWFSGPKSNNQVLKSQQTDFTYQAGPLNWVGDGWPTVMNVLPIRTTITLPNGKVSKVEKDYDTNAGTISYGTISQQREYDFGSGAPGPLLRCTQYTYKAFQAPAYLAANLLDLPSQVSVYNGACGTGTLISQTSSGYDEYSAQSSGVTTQRDTTIPALGTRGNLSSVKKWLNTTGGTLNSSIMSYDTGMPYQSTDPGSHTTTYTYSTTYAGAYLTQTQYPDTHSPNLAHHIVSATYDFNSGGVKTFTDENSQTSTYQYDALARMTNAAYPDGGSANLYYPDYVTVESQKLIDAGGRKTDAYIRYDGLGRPSRKLAFNDEASPSTQWDEVDTCYDNMGQVSYTSYPYQGSGIGGSKSCAGPGDTFAHDAVGRNTLVTHSDGQTVITSYTGAATDVQDEGNGTARVERVSQTNGLGQLISVCEVSANTQLGGTGSAPVSCGQDIAKTGFLTNYSYDMLGNLTSTQQSGLNARTFVYDSLSRLTSATNPETGLVQYTYNTDGLLINRSRPQANQTSTSVLVNTVYGYDEGHRLLSKSYTLASNGAPDSYTPYVGLAYDEASVQGHTVANPIGHLTSATTVWSGQSAKLTGDYFYSFDQMGRTLNEYQCTPRTCPLGSGNNLAYTYDYAGDLLTEANTSTGTQTNAYNRANRLYSVVDSQPGAGTLVPATHYGPFGVSSVSYGSSPSETTGYDARGRINSKTLISGANTLYSFSLGYSPDGSIQTANDNVNGNWTYSYDEFNRLKTASGAGHSLQPGYDRFGNLWHEYSSTGFQYSFTGANNRIDSFASNYDAQGNLLYDAGMHHYLFDAEGRIVSTDTGTVYAYDASGRRVAKQTGSASSVNNTDTNEYLLDLTGNQMAELNGSGALQHTNVYSGGQLIATLSGGTASFHETDWLGSRRVQFGSTGVVTLNCSNLPFGDGLSCTGSGADATEHHFTGKERDTESGLDYFGARYYGSSMGRFMSPDSLGGDPMNPQSWNLYGYVQNNPLKNVDPDGHDCVVQTRTSNTTETVSSSAGNCDNVSVGDGQTKTYVAGTVTGIQAGADGHSIDIGYTAYGSNGDNSTSVTNASAAPIPDNTNLAYNWGNNAQGYQQLGAASQVVKGATVGVAAVYGGVACAIACPGAAAAVGRWGLQRLAMGASSPVLLNLINRLYQAQDEIPGGTAGAVRNEVMTGEFINGGHAIKASEMITALSKLINSGELSGSDQMIAGHIISDLKNSLGR